MREVPLDVPIVCTLQPSGVDDRLAAWQAALAVVVDRQATEDGVRLTLPRTVDVPALAQLIADEQTCCAFLTFTLTISTSDVVLDVATPPDGLPVLHALIGIQS